MSNIVNFNTWTPKKKPDPVVAAKKVKIEEDLKRRISLSLDEACILSAVIIKGIEKALREGTDESYLVEPYLKILNIILPDIVKSNSINDIDLQIDEGEIDTLLIAVEELPNPSLEKLLSRNFEKENAIENTIAYIYATLRQMNKRIQDRIHRIKGTRSTLEENLKAIAEYIPSFDEGYNAYLESMTYRKEQYENMYLSKHSITLEGINFINNGDLDTSYQEIRFFISPLREPFEQYNNSLFEGNDNFIYIEEDSNDINFGPGWRLVVKRTSDDLHKLQYEEMEETEAFAINTLNKVIEADNYNLISLSDREENMNDKIEFLTFILNTLETLELTSNIKLHNLDKERNLLVEYLKKEIYSLM